MRPLAVVCTHTAGPFFLPALKFLSGSELVEEVLVVGHEPIPDTIPRCSVLNTGSFASRETLRVILARIQTEYLLIIPPSHSVSIGPETLEKILEAARSTGSSLTYSDFYDETGNEKTLHPLNDYQPGSVRDDFNFGSLVLLNTRIVRGVLEKYGPAPAVRHSALYDLRLKMSIDNIVHHIKKPLYSIITQKEGRDGEPHFAYVDPRNQVLQREMETVFTDHLKRIGAWLPPERLKKTGETGQQSFPVEASVIIPVRNRKGTVADAVQSALTQDTEFSFNVIVVDNHSTDGTSRIIADLAAREKKLKHIIPARQDLGIGGCWNEALFSDLCGRYAIQLDSDDLYENPLVLGTIVDTLREGSYAMVVGSYTIVNEKLEQIPPGLIDHREWTDGNGHNNALRINGLGAPRAFDTAVMRSIGFLNVSYGEDYAAALNICRQYRIGRIYESLYLCRRWTGNTDAALSIEAANKNDAFKDSIRTEEILRRQEMLKGPGK